MEEIRILDTPILPEKETVLYLNVAHLPTRTVIDIPVFVYRAQEPGPRILFSAGLHGDEINGVEIVRNILDNKLFKVTRGMVVCVPIINVYGFIYFSRYVPDGKDVNRSFPGSANGSLASKVAYTVMHHIVPYIDFGIDYHTGGSQRTNYPQIRGDFSDPEILDLAKRTHAPFLIHSGMIPGSFRMEAYEKGKKLIVYEGGESLRFDKFAISEGINCAHRLLHSFNMASEMPQPCLSSNIIKDTSWYRSPDSGMWIPLREYGDFVETGQNIGYVTSPYGDFKSDVIADKTGYILGLNNQAVVNKGDALVNLGTISF
ncbi:MAG: succinylglutamate desuccinylase/aspartoacylase family protein [Flavobacteriaceae bacterium]|nr:succinylglutamate desuccinylase/aspartoacylase family protein [Flavobacteriaceae bacterium]